MSIFKDKVVAITGAASGIGQALAVALASRGARLALSDLSVASLEEGTRAMLPAGTEARLYAVDVASREAVWGHAEAVQGDFGGTDFVVNNAGTSVLASVEHVAIEEIERVLGINLWGVIYGTKAFLPAMLARRAGCIVNISSVFGLVATPCSVAYTMSKFAVRGLTETLWQELEGTGVRAVLVHPGGTATNISKSPRFAGPMEQYMYEANLRMMVTPPAEVAAQIVDGLESGAPRLLVGHGAHELHQLSLAHADDYGTILREMMAAPQ
jgi:short-subunit dehydrogenase